MLSDNMIMLARCTYNPLLRLICHNHATATLPLTSTKQYYHLPSIPNKTQQLTLSPLCLPTQSAQQLSITNLPLILIESNLYLDNLRESMMAGSAKVFYYGMDPVEFELQLILYYSLHSYTSKALNRLREFSREMRVRTEHIKRKEQIEKNKYMDEGVLLDAYRRRRCTTILTISILHVKEVMDEYMVNLCELMRGVRVLNSSILHYGQDGEWCVRNNYLSNFQLRMVISNLSMIVENQNRQFMSYWGHLEVVRSVLNHYMQRVYIFQYNLMEQLLMVVSRLKVYHGGFGESLLRTIEGRRTEDTGVLSLGIEGEDAGVLSVEIEGENRGVLNLGVVLTAVLYLAEMRCFPFALFYSEYQRWYDMISNMELYSNKKIGMGAKVLSILTKRRLYCSHLYSQQVVSLLQQNIPAFDLSQLISMLLMYSKMKTGHSREFVALVIVRVKMLFKDIKLKDCVKLIKAIATLRHFDSQLIGMLKGYDFSQIHFEISNMEPEMNDYFIAVLDEICEKEGEKRFTHIYDDQQIVLL